MVEMVVQLVLVCLWGSVVSNHTRRLLRLARVEALPMWRSRHLRTKLKRVWWWLGREEYWRAVYADGLRCMQITLMVFVFAWGLLR
ncbi:MAG TPA: hypothetical protein PKA05_04350 [Roseiflexaceae bacterium]|nr:hypothetical protein [Roseiflexaceae bacterium]HMP39590.1 hypothetical protein [Roseiflexaceae bacterium]